MKPEEKRKDRVISVLLLLIFGALLVLSVYGKKYYVYVLIMFAVLVFFITRGYKGTKKKATASKESADTSAPHSK